MRLTTLHRGTFFVPYGTSRIYRRITSPARRLTQRGTKSVGERWKEIEDGGDPCVAGAVVAARDGLYEVEAEIGALLIECFGFVEVEAAAKPSVAPAPRRRRGAQKT